LQATPHEILITYIIHDAKVRLSEGKAKGKLVFHFFSE
jgi:hypothetical protein